MTLEEAACYLRHHLVADGRSDTPFSDHAIALIHTTSRGSRVQTTTSPSKRCSPRSPLREAIVDESPTRTAVGEVTLE